MVEWRVVKEFPDYAVSADGQIKRIVAASGTAPEKILKCSTDSDGYKFIRIYKNGKRKFASLHRLVASEFLDPDPNRTQVAHNDGNPSNNLVSNLRWATNKENCGDKLLHGTHLQGESCGSSKLCELNVRNIRRLHASGYIFAEIAPAYSVSAQTISSIVKKTAWRHIT